MNKVKCLMALLCIYTQCFTQNSKPLSIGDTVPDIVLNHIINYKTPTAKLSDFKGKLLILDFWDTWCTACINTFPHNNELQRRFGGRLQILNVGFQQESKIRTFLTNLEKRRGADYKITTVTDDTVLQQLFPHTFIPHLVWIGTDGVVKAVTPADKLSQQNIEKILDNKTVNFQQKKDIALNKPSFLPPVILDSPFNLEHYSLLVKGGVYDGAGVGQYYFGKGEKIYGCNYTNYTLESICYHLANKLFQNPKEHDYFNKKRYKIEIKDTAMLQQFKSGIWQYSFFLPQDFSDSFFYKALREIGNYTAYDAVLEKRKMPCLVLRKSNNAHLIATKGAKAENNLFLSDSSHITNLPLSVFVNFLDDDTKITDLPIVDETGYRGKVDIALHAPYTIASIDEQLHAYGLTLIPSQREIETLTVKLKKQ